MSELLEGAVDEVRRATAALASAGPESLETAGLALEGAASRLREFHSLSQPKAAGKLDQALALERELKLCRERLAALAVALHGLAAARGWAAGGYTSAGAARRWQPQG